MEVCSSDTEPHRPAQITGIVFWHLNHLQYRQPVSQARSTGDAPPNHEVALSNFGAEHPQIDNFGAEPRKTGP